MTREYIDETIRVLADYEKGKLTPHLFQWQGRVFKIEHINIQYITTIDNKQYHYAVNCGTQETYELFFDPQQIIWKLDKIFSA